MQENFSRRELIEPSELRRLNEKSNIMGFFQLFSHLIAILLISVLHYKLMYSWWSLASGFWSLASGFWSLVTGFRHRGNGRQNGRPFNFEHLNIRTRPIVIENRESRIKLQQQPATRNQPSATRNKEPVTRNRLLSH